MTTLKEIRHDPRWTVQGVAMLLAVQAAAASVALLVGNGRPRWDEAVAVAAGICLVGSIGGWLLARKPARDPALAVAGGLAAAGLRLILPLAALVWLQGRGAGLRDAGAGGLLVAFYLTLLATDILLHIMGRSRDRAPGGQTSKN
jgi:hypothetical protein